MIHGKEVVEEANMTAEERLDRGYMKFGCPHYRRRCRIRAPCCNEIFDCQCCHNEAKNAIFLDLKQRHEVPRHQVQKVVCSLCGIEQDVHQVCINCGVCMGKYLCETCKLFDDDVSKKQYHCSGCGICRIGGHENFCHCFKCGMDTRYEYYVWILCNDCGTNSLVQYHIIAQKCLNCKSYNTCQTRGTTD